MAKNNIKHLEDTEKLKEENKLLRQKLLEAGKYINAVKLENIDALVMTDEDNLKVYTEKTADKTYRILIEKMHEGAVTVDKNGTILYCNSYFAKMIGLPIQKVIGVNFKDFIVDTLKEPINALFRKAWLTPIKKEVYLQTNHGNTTAVLMSVNALSVDNNLFLSIILTDLTIQNKNQVELNNRSIQLEQKNIELESTNKDLTAFTYVSSHDLQEPLRKIQLFVDRLLGEEIETLTDIGKNYLQRTYETAKRMRTLIDDLLEYSRTKNAERKFERTDLTVIMDEIKNDFKDELFERKATIAITDLGTIKIIRFQFRQLMHNLINNSLKFANPLKTTHIRIKGKIVKGSKLKLKKSDPAAGPVKQKESAKLSSKINYCHITYTDNGIGFDSKYNEKIFEVFQRLHSKDEYKGTGIGLAICRRIVENHLGRITASGKIGEGARFDIYIPVE